jgi:hypothetical protein
MRKRFAAGTIDSMRLRFMMASFPHCGWDTERAFQNQLSGSQQEITQAETKTAQREGEGPSFVFCA